MNRFNHFSKHSKYYTVHAKNNNLKAWVNVVKFNVIIYKVSLVFQFIIFFKCDQMF